MGYVVHIGEIRSGYKILVGKLERIIWETYVQIRGQN